MHRSEELKWKNGLVRKDLERILVDTCKYKGI